MAMGGADETIKINFVVNTQQAVANATEFRARIDAIKAQLIDLSKTSGMAMKDIAEGMRQAAKTSFTDPFGKLDAGKYATFNKALTQGLREAEAEAKNVTTSLNKMASTGGAISKLGGIIKNAFSFFLGGSIFMAVTRLIGGFQTLIKTGEDYAQTIYRLAISINQLQRRGLDITIKSEIALIKELRQEYETFSQKGVIEALAAVQMLTRNFGFSQEQIKKTTQLSMDLALVQGKDVGETAKQLALFYSSGYGEGLQHAGLAVNRLTVLNEAHRMGLEKSYMQLTELERAQAAYNLVARQTVDLHKDAMKIQDNVIGQIREQRSGIEDVTNEIALKALPVELAWLKVKLAFIAALGGQIDKQDAYWESVKKVASEQGKVYDEMSFMEQQKFLQQYRDEIMKGLDAEIKNKKDEWEKILSGTLDVNVDTDINLGDSEGEELAEAREKIGQQIMDLYEDIENEQEDFNDKSAELEQDHMDKLADIDADALDEQREIWKDYQRDILDAQEDFQEKLADIERDLAQDIEEAHIDYNRDLEDIERDYQQSVQDAARKYRENELKAERDYQEKLRRLREEFLFDLEDALRERDALQVLRLIRRYNLDKEQLERQNDLDKEGRADAYREELRDLRIQAERKRQDALRNLEQEIIDAQVAAQRKREDAQRALDQQLLDAQESYEKERADALAAAQEKRDDEAANYAERQEKLQEDLDERINKILEAFGKELGITGTSLEDLKILFAQYFGDKGAIPEEIDKYISKITESADATSSNVESMMGYIATLTATVQANVAAINTSLGGLNWNALANQTPTVPGISAPDPDKFAGGFAFGGSVYANTPTMAMFGEVPEVATFTPLSKMNTQSSSPLGGANGGGNMKIQILLGPGLEAQIIDNSLGSMAEILQDALGVRL